MIYVLDSEHKKVFSKTHKGIKEIACEKDFMTSMLKVLNPKNMKNYLENI